jgi:hypothetical protein
MASMVLIAMGCVALAFSLILRKKSRALQKFPKSPQIKIFKKTFNVFDPYSEQRKVIHEHLQLLILLAIYGSFIGIGFAILAMLQVGFLLGFMVLIVCLGFLLLDETLEVHKNANIFLKAFKNEVSFGKGDLEALDFLRQTLPRLSHYHLSVAIAFFATSLAVPSVVNIFVLAFAQWAGVIFAASAAFWFFPPFVLICTGILFAATVFVVQFAAGKVKRRIFSFPSPQPLNGMSEQFYRMKMFVGIQHHHPTLHLPEVEQKKTDEKDVEQTEA